MHKEHAFDGEPGHAFLIAKPRRFWIPGLVADILNNSIIIYDTKEGIELGSEIVERYLARRQESQLENLR